MIIQKKSLADMVAEQLRQQITEGVYTIGDKLPTEPELMKTFKVGRSSIREAVKLLVNMGVVQVRQGAGTFVAEASDTNGGSINMNIADRTELDEVRKILDIAIVEKAVARRTEKDIERMQSSLEARKANAKDGLLKECIEADMNFHIAIADATHIGRHLPFCFPAFAFGVQSYLRWYGLLHKFTIFSREVVEIHHCRRFEERPEDGNTDCRRAIERETTKNMTIK